METNYSIHLQAKGTTDEYHLDQVRQSVSYDIICIAPNTNAFILYSQKPYKLSKKSWKTNFQKISEELTFLFLQDVYSILKDDLID